MLKIRKVNIFTKISMSDRYFQEAAGLPSHSRIPEFQNSIHPAQSLCVASGPESVPSPCSAKDGSLDVQQLHFISNQQNGDFLQSHLQHSWRK